MQQITGLFDLTLRLYRSYILEICITLSLIFIFCDLTCGQLTKWPPYVPQEKICPRIGDHNIYMPKVPWGTPNRAWLTIPPEITVQQTTIPQGGLGAFSNTFLLPNTWLGIYEGEIYLKDQYNTPYAWTIPRNNTYAYQIDAGRLATSNWLRWVNCPRNLKEENVKGVYCYGRIMYVIAKPIAPGQELFVYYGDSYALHLGIDTSQFAHPFDIAAQKEREAQNAKDHATKQCMCPCPCT